jgi:hypothetical protein
MGAMEPCDIFKKADIHLSNIDKNINGILHEINNLKPIFKETNNKLDNLKYWLMFSTLFIILTVDGVMIFAFKYFFG